MKKYFLLLSLVTIYGCNSPSDEKALFNKDISVFKSEESLVSFLQKMERYDEIDRAYTQEKIALREVHVWAKKKDNLDVLSETYEEVVVTGTRATIESSINSKKVSTQITDGLSADEIGDIPALSIGEALETVTGASGGKESITNNQEAQADQGDIVKRAGDYLIVLRKGVLYSLSIGKSTNTPMELISKADLQGESKTHNAWYDELLVSNNLLIVTGYSYGSKGGAELALFHIDDYGKIEFNQRYIIKSSDYYDSENSATRIVDNHLVMVLPNYLDNSDLVDISEDEGLSTQYVSHYLPNTINPERVNIASKRTWVNSGRDTRAYNGNSDILRCPLNNLLNNKLECRITSILGVGGYDSEFYVNGNAVYIWSDSKPSLDYSNINEQDYDQLIRSSDFESSSDSYDNKTFKQIIYRLDLRSGELGGALVNGYPINQYSFQAKAGQFSGISTQYFPIPGIANKHKYTALVEGITFNIEQFSATPTTIPESSYTKLSENRFAPSANRFAGDYAIMSTDRYTTEAEYKSSSIVTWNRKTNDVQTASSAFRVTAFHPQGNSMLAMGGGTNDELALESWVIAPELKSLSSKSYDSYLQAESRSVGFNSRPYKDGFVFGIPVYKTDSNGLIETYKDTEGRSQDIIDIAYFKNPLNDAFSEIGKLEGSQELVEDNCIVSCDEWYGVARPFFIGDYIYALIDDEMIKGEYSSNSIKTLNRLNLINGQVSFE